MSYTRKTGKPLNTTPFTKVSDNLAILLPESKSELCSHRNLGRTPNLDFTPLTSTNASPEDYTVLQLAPSPDKQLLIHHNARKSIRPKKNVTWKDIKEEKSGHTPKNNLKENLLETQKKRSWWCCHMSFMSGHKLPGTSLNEDESEYSPRIKRGLS